MFPVSSFLAERSVSGRSVMHVYVCIFHYYFHKSDLCYAIDGGGRNRRRGGGSARRGIACSQKASSPLLIIETGFDCLFGNKFPNNCNDDD